MRYQLNVWFSASPFFNCSFGCMDRHNEADSESHTTRASPYLAQRTSHSLPCHTDCQKIGNTLLPNILLIFDSLLNHIGTFCSSSMNNKSHLLRRVS